MAINLAGLKKVTAQEAPRCIIYGPPGVGKTSLAAEAPNPVFLMTESGVPAGMEPSALGPSADQTVHTDFETVMDALALLRDEEHDFRSIVIDTVDGLEKLVWDYVCKQQNWPSIEAPGFGRGYTEALYVWRLFIGICDELRAQRGIIVIWLAHSQVRPFDDPTHGPYSRYILNVHAKAADALTYDADIVGFMNIGTEIQEEDRGFNQKTRTAKSEGARFLHLDRRASFDAKNRYGLPPKIRCQPGQGWAKIAEKLPGAEPKKTKKEKEVA